MEGINLKQQQKQRIYAKIEDKRRIALIKMVKRRRGLSNNARYRKTSHWVRHVTC
jgi:hypothetical protein